MTPKPSPKPSQPDDRDDDWPGTSGGKPAGPVAPRDESVLESLGEAISAPIIKGDDDGATPPPAGADKPRKG